METGYRNVLRIFREKCSDYPFYPIVLAYVQTHSRTSKDTDFEQSIIGKNRFTLKLKEPSKTKYGTVCNV